MGLASDVLKGHTQTLQEKRSAHRQTNETLGRLYNGVRFRTSKQAKDRKQELLKAIGESKSDLHGASLSLKQEKETRRRISDLEAQLEKVNEFIDNDFGSQFEDRDSKKKEVQNQEEIHEKYYKEFTGWKNTVANIQSDIEEMKLQKTKLEENIKQAKDQKSKNESDFRDSLDKYARQINNRNRLRTAIAEKKYQKDIEKQRAVFAKQAQEEESRRQAKSSKGTSASSEKSEAQLRREKEAAEAEEAKKLRIEQCRERREAA